MNIEAENKILNFNRIVYSNCSTNISKDLFHSKETKTGKSMWFIQWVNSYHKGKKYGLGALHEMTGKWK